MARLHVAVAVLASIVVATLAAPPSLPVWPPKVRISSFNLGSSWPSYNCASMLVWSPFLLIL